MLKWGEILSFLKQTGKFNTKLIARVDREIGVDGWEDELFREKLKKPGIVYLLGFGHPLLLIPLPVLEFRTISIEVLSCDIPAISYFDFNTLALGANYELLRNLPNMIKCFYSWLLFMLLIESNNKLFTYLL